MQPVTILSFTLLTPLLIVPAWAQQGGSHVQVGNTGYAIQYHITSGEVTNATALVEAKSILILASGSGSTVLTVTLPRGLIDARAGTSASSADSAFVVSDDGIPVRFTEAANATSRTLSIPFTYSTTPERIQITGTAIVPEFGSAAIPVMAAGAALLVLLSARTAIGRVS